jgi:hypothetical protein
LINFKIIHNKALHTDVWKLRHFRKSLAKRNVLSLTNGVGFTRRWGTLR